MGDDPLGERIAARNPDRQSAEVHIRNALMNRFSTLGAAENVRAARPRWGNGKLRLKLELYNSANLRRDGNEKDPASMGLAKHRRSPKRPSTLVRNKSAIPKWHRHLYLLVAMQRYLSPSEPGRSGYRRGYLHGSDKILRLLTCGRCA